MRQFDPLCGWHITPEDMFNHQKEYTEGLNLMEHIWYSEDHIKLQLMEHYNE